MTDSLCRKRKLADSFITSDNSHMDGRGSFLLSTSAYVGDNKMQKKGVVMMMVVGFEINSSK